MHNFRNISLDTLPIAEKLLTELQQLWQKDFSKEELQANLDMFSQHVLPPETSQDTATLFDNMVKNFKMFVDAFERGDIMHTMTMIGPLKIAVKALKVSGDSSMKIACHDLDLFLTALETRIHPDVIKKLKIDSWQDINRIVELILSKSSSAYSDDNNAKVFFKSNQTLNDFKKHKTWHMLELALHEYHEAILLYNVDLVYDFKKYFLERTRFNTAQIETKLSILYRCGAVFELDQLITFLEEHKRKIKEIVDNEPKTITAHLFDSARKNLGM
jgi:hypothetical protein